MARRPADYYPTPPDVVVGLRHLLQARRNAWNSKKPFFDPCAGMGSMPAFLDIQAPWILWELREQCREVLLRYSDDVKIQNALWDERGAERRIRRWPIANMLTNTPYQIADEFHDRVIWRARRREVLAAGLGRTSYWQVPTAKRDLPPPDVMGLLRWRPDFTSTSAKGQGYMQSFQWSVWLPRPLKKPQVFFIDRPIVPQSYWDLYAEMQHPTAGRQGSLQIC